MFQTTWVTPATSKYIFRRGLLFRASPAMTMVSQDSVTILSLFGSFTFFLVYPRHFVLLFFAE